MSTRSPAPPIHQVGSTSVLRSSATPPIRKTAAKRPALDPIWIALPVLTLLTFSSVFSNGFINLDDTVYITNNHWVKAGLSWRGIQWAFTHSHMGLYHPLGTVPLMAVRTFFGMAAAPYHAFSLCLHIFNALLVFYLLRRMTGARWRSALAAAIFAVHPLRVESVAWASEAKDVLSVLFALLAICAYLAYARAPAWWRLALVAGLQALSLLAKPMFVTLPLLLLLLDYWPLRRLEGERFSPARLMQLLLEKWPLMVVSIADTVAVLLITGDDTRTVLPYKKSYSLAVRLLNIPVSYERYVWKMFDVFHLAAYYPMPAHWPIVRVVLDLVGILLITGAAAWFGRRHRHLLVGWLWFLIILLPVIGILQVSTYSIADRYTYLATLGLIVMLIWSLPDRLFVQPPRVRAAVVGAVALLLTLCYFTSVQVTYWRDGVTVFSRTLDVTSDNAVANVLAGNALLGEGRLSEAEPYLERALAIDSNSTVAHESLGVVYASQNRLEEAQSELQKALSSHTLNAALDERNLARVLLQRGERGPAVQHLKAALQMDPDDSKARTILAGILEQDGDTAGAMVQINLALQSHPEDEEARRMLSLAKIGIGRPPVGETSVDNSDREKRP